MAKWQGIVGKFWLLLSTIVGMIIIIGGASIVGRVVKVISLNNSESVNSEESSTFEENFKNDFNDLVLGNSTDHLIWFMQKKSDKKGAGLVNWRGEELSMVESIWVTWVSDLHLSIFHDKSRLLMLEKFANETVSVVKPSVVLASGDLTDAKTIDMLGSKQYVEEWKYYKGVLDKSHNFDVPSLTSKNNFYQIYSSQGPKHLRSYMYTLKKGTDSVSFIAVDACLLPGPRRPFNFIGVLTSKEMEALVEFEKESKKSNYTIWFGHYPTSCIISPDPGIRKLMGQGLAYLCGHLHTLVWSLSKISQVKVRFDEKGKWQMLIPVQGPLYVAPWIPSKYEKGIHMIEVFAEDISGRKRKVSHYFALDDSEVNFAFWPRVILMSNVSVVFQFLFGVSVCLCVIPLCVVRWMHHRAKGNKMLKPRIRSWIIRIWVRKLWVLCAVDKLFWPLVCYSVYLPVGPWFIGKVLDNHIGVVFAWGTFVYSSYLPGSLTYAYGFLQIIMFQCPLLLITAHSSDIRVVGKIWASFPEPIVETNFAVQDDSMAIDCDPSSHLPLQGGSQTEESVDSSGPTESTGSTSDPLTSLGVGTSQKLENTHSETFHTSVGDQ
ncbi:Transmembrane protein 62 [Armadillidium nasatum]|uniref:Transmembrane protein 62 n=1 Tax=Armadillidium nasatum TaxID=96803 RepID=A0A5N5SSN7_9CRUS|nr:Transmembrane protein 62 [Armadillidium nasatum]